MNNLLLEIYGEEIPSSSQILIEKQFQILFKELFQENKIFFKSIETFSTARRVTLVAENLPSKIESKKIEIRGPQVDANQNAISGFLKSNNIKELKKLETKRINNKIYYIAKKKSEEKEISIILEEKIPQILRSIKWVKSMRWANNNDKWIRPIKNILCVFKKKEIKFEFAGIKSNSFTFGNYYFDHKKIKCLDFITYKKNIKKNYVVLDKKDRKKMILDKIEKFCKSNNLTFEIDNLLLERVSSSVEYPNLYFSSFESDFFKLPNFLLEEIMTNKQNYFSFKNRDSKLSNTFCFVAGINSKKKSNLINGNQNVLKARFSDASFFIDEDLKKKSEERLNLLKDIIFYDKSGNLYQRAKRIDLLVRYILELLGKDFKKYYKYLILSSTDLTTELVKEFPNLQGKVGGYYAKKEKIPEIVHNAFSDQYNYEFSKSYNNYLTYVLSISQKFDSIIGYFISKKKVSGAGDPFGIRRSSLSVIKICIEKKISIDFYDLFSFLIKLYSEQNINSKILYTEFHDFFKKRIFILLTGIGYRNDVIKASIDDKNINPYLVLKRVINLSKFINSKIGKDFLQAFKRLNSLISEQIIDEPDEKLFKKNDESILNDLSNEFEKLANNEETDFIFENTSLLQKMTFALNNFFDNVIVNVEDEDIKKNRKILICKFHKNLEDRYSFSSLEI